MQENRQLIRGSLDKLQLRDDRIPVVLRRQGRGNHSFENKAGVLIRVLCPL